MNSVLSAQQLLKYLVAGRFSGCVRNLQTTSAISHKDGSTTQQHDGFGDETVSAEKDEPFTDDSEGEDQLRIEILNAALPFVHSVGWSQDALAQGAECLGYSGMAHGMFQKGGVELVNHFYASCNERLKGSLEEKIALETEQPKLKQGTTLFVANAVEERLRMNIEYIDTWHKALALHASPLNAGTAVENLTTLVDHIWYYAGDRSTDFNWYTKRGLLAAVYKSSEIYMIQDKSDDFQETWTFMNRRLSDVLSVGKCIRSASNFTESFRDVSKAGIFTALNVLGMNNRSR